MLRLFCFFSFSRLYGFTEAAALRSIVLQYIGALIATHVSFFFPFVYLEVSLFPSTFVPLPLSLLWRVRRTFSLPGGVFLPCNHGLDFLNQLL